MNAVTDIIAPRCKDLGGFSVQRILPSVRKKTIGPWIFFDHAGPAEFVPGDEGINVRPHPHIHLATVTYLFEGEILHRDSIGSVQAIRPGDINLMVAGKGITHSEREYDARKEMTRRLHALQLWLALPEKDEYADPAFYHYPSVNIPVITLPGVVGRVMIGEAYGMISPVKTFSPTLYIEADIASGKELQIPAAQERAVYVVDGSVTIDGTVIAPFHMALIAEGADISVCAGSGPARIVIIGGDAIGPRFIDWNFVSSDKKAIEKAKDDWQNGRFPTVPGDEKDVIPLPAQ